MKSLCAFILFITLYVVPLSAFSHHSPFLYFDPSKSVIVEGTITDYKWRNPHVEFTLSVKSDKGDQVDWLLETHSVSILKRMQLTTDDIKIGDVVKVAGWPSKKSGEVIFITNMLAPTGEEIVFDSGAPLIWSEERVGDPSVWLETHETIEANLDSDIFHVWSTPLVNGDSNLLFENYDFKLTNDAAEKRRLFDMHTHPIIGTCVFKGMPTIMEQPYPMQFARSKDLIIMHMEEGNTVRVFDMNPDADYSNEMPTNLGHSKGEWQGTELVVTTTGADWPLVDLTGVPNSPSSVFTERFSPSVDGKILSYSLTIDDPEVFSAKPIFTKEWLAIPDQRVEPYNCESD